MTDPLPFPPEANVAGTQILSVCIRLGKRRVQICQALWGTTTSYPTLTPKKKKNPERAGQRLKSLESGEEVSSPTSRQVWEWNLWPRPNESPHPQRLPSHSAGTSAFAQMLCLVTAVRTRQGSPLPCVASHVIWESSKTCKVSHMILVRDLIWNYQ